MTHFGPKFKILLIMLHSFRSHRMDGPTPMQQTRIFRSPVSQLLYICLVTLIRILPFKMSRYLLYKRCLQTSAAHWIDENFKHQNFVLHVEHFPGQHKADDIRAKYLDMCRRWGIDPARRLYMVCDGALNMQKGLGAVLVLIHCTCHVIQLCLGVSVAEIL